MSLGSVANFVYFRPTGLIQTVVPLCLGPCRPRLCDHQVRFQHSCFHPHDDFQHRLPSDRARRFTLHASSRWFYVRFGPPPLDTGEVAILTGHVSFEFIFIFLRKGVIWLIIGCVAEIPPVVSPGSLYFSTLVYVPFSS